MYGLDESTLLHVDRVWQVYNSPFLRVGDAGQGPNRDILGCRSRIPKRRGARWHGPTEICQSHDRKRGQFPPAAMAQSDGRNRDGKRYFFESESFAPLAQA
jgi:hypothetical protein